MKPFLLISLGLLAGCSTIEVRTEVKVLQTKEIILTEIDEQYLRDCKIIKPATPDQFLKMGSDEREDHLTRVLISQYAEVGVCNIDKQRLRSLIDRQKQLVEKHNQDEVERVQKLKMEMEKVK